MSEIKKHDNPFKTDWVSRAIWTVGIGYVIYTFLVLDITFKRFLAGLGYGGEFIGRMIPPNFDRWQLLLSDMMESLQIAIIATILGVFISLFVGLFAARNLMPGWLTVITRAFIALCRSFHPIIIAILFVKALGFGALAGTLTLIFASIGFIAKLFAEAIEEISLKQVEAVRATGASFVGIILFGVLPQVLNRFIGFSTYQLDSNLRNSTMVGIVGAGGIGGTLFAAFQRFDYDFVAAILISIISLIMVGEFLSNQVKRLFK